MIIVKKIKDYFIGSISEVKKVVWPSKKQAVRYSMIVIALSLGMAAFFGILDYALNLGLEKIINNEKQTSAPTDDMDSEGETSPIGEIPSKPADSGVAPPTEQ